MLSERKQAILSAIIKTHIVTGEPVGSKVLSSSFGLSSATLRNEMSDLCELGFLEQPHTSAGRIPSYLGYKLYAENLLSKTAVSEDIKSCVDAMFSLLPPDPEYIPREAARLLSDLTGLTAFSTNIVSENAKVKRVEILPFSSHSVMMVLITSDGTSRNRVCRSSYSLYDNTVNLFKQIASEKIEGTYLKNLTPAYMQTVISSAGADAFSVISLMSSLFGMVNDVSREKVNISGESNLFKGLKNDAAAGRLLEYMSQTDTFVPILNKAPSKISVLFGEDTDIDALCPSCMIVARYTSGLSDTGRIGIIGPTRMAYDSVIPSIEYFSYKLGNLMTEALKDMEAE